MNISQNAQPIKVYISFAQEDQGYKDELLKHLNSLQTITTWSRADLIAGDNVKDKIEQNISTANIAILLASPDYWVSDSINDSEFPQILERYNKGKIKVVPINIRPNTPYKTAISELEVLPKGGKPINSWRDKDKAWTSVVKDLSQILNNLRGEQTQQGKQEETIRKQKDTILESLGKELPSKSDKHYKSANSKPSLRKTALIIGCNNYKFGSKLENPINDARAMQRELEELGFTVSLQTNTNLRDLKTAVNIFGD